MSTRPPESLFERRRLYLDIAAEKLSLEIGLHKMHHTADYEHGPLRSSSLESLGKKYSDLMHLYQEIDENLHELQTRNASIDNLRTNNLIRLAIASAEAFKYTREACRDPLYGDEQVLRAIESGIVFSPFVETIPWPVRIYGRYLFSRFERFTRTRASTMEQEPLRDLASLVQERFVPAQLHPRQQDRAADLRKYVLNVAYSR